MSLKEELKQFRENMTTMTDQLKAEIADRHKKYHVHVYMVWEMAEVDIRAETDEKALAAAIDTVKKQKFKRSDCNYLAVIPEGGDTDETE